MTNVAPLGLKIVAVVMINLAVMGWKINMDFLALLEDIHKMSMAALDAAEAELKKSKEILDGLEGK